MASSSKTPSIIVPLVQTFIVGKLKWNDGSFTYWTKDGTEETTVEAKRFVAAHRIGPDQIALTYIFRFNWREPENATKTSVNDWLDRWDRPGQTPIFLRKPRPRKPK